MGRTSERDVARNRRKAHIRKKVRGDAERPRLCVFRSTNHVYAQIIDDVRGHTLVAASTLSPELKEHTGHGGNVTAAREVGLLVAKKAIEAGVTAVCFDRNGYLYHGCVKALADGAREGGLNF